MEIKMPGPGRWVEGGHTSETKRMDHLSLGYYPVDMWSLEEQIFWFFQEMPEIWNVTENLPVFFYVGDKFNLVFNIVQVNIERSKGGSEQTFEKQCSLQTSG